MTLPKSKNNKRTIKPKPFVKWAGGKGNLLSKLDEFLPTDFDEIKNLTYIEPFVGGGAMLFHLLRNHKNISRVIINDINSDLINCYLLIKDNPYELIDRLSFYQNTFDDAGMNIEARKQIYETFRESYNEDELSTIERCALFIFLNRTCFNGLYRVNSKGKFNVPMGRYKHPVICDAALILEDSKFLNSVDITILNGDYKGIIQHLSGTNTNFVYFDPPYRPISNSSYFKEYSNSPFGDSQQEELKLFCDSLSNKDCKIMLSNSDSKNEDGSSYFEELYDGYDCRIVYAARAINAFAEKRVKQTEVLIRNY